MKRLLLLAALAVPVCLTVMAAAPVSEDVPTIAIGTDTIDSQFTATGWERIDTIIVLKTDTCVVTYALTGQVTLDYGQRLYARIVDISNDTAYSDTLTLSLPDRGLGPQTIKWGIDYQGDTLKSQTDASDTIICEMAVGGSSEWEKVIVTNVRITAAIQDIGV